MFIKLLNQEYPKNTPNLCNCKKECPNWNGNAKKINFLCLRKVKHIAYLE
jgi:hypothetical protein